MRYCILDPAVGRGELLIPIVRKIKEASPLSRLRLVGIDRNRESLSAARKSLHRVVEELELIEEDFLEADLSEKFDLAIANPPYVRTQNIPLQQRKKLCRRFSIRGRLDLYQVFILKMLEHLKTGGCLALIIPNKLLTTQSASQIRNVLESRFNHLTVIDLGDTKLFDAAVLPAIVLATDSDAPSRMTTIYSTSKSAERPLLSSLESGIYKSCAGNFEVKNGLLSRGLWRLQDPHIDKWLSRVERYSYCRFGDIGKTRVGVKTTADQIFIRDDWEYMENRPELLYPLHTHHLARRYRYAETTRFQILYPHTLQQGKCVAVDLKQYPNTRCYLEAHRERLSKRAYLKAAGRAWYEIWVPHNPEYWKYPKLVFRDIVQHPVFWMDQTGAIVNGDCYWLTDFSGSDLLWLALAVGNSTFIERYYDFRFNNRLYAGRRRFITQYVKEFPVPKPANSTQLLEAVKEAYAQADNLDNQFQQRLDHLVYSSFGLESED